MVNNCQNFIMITTTTSRFRRDLSISDKICAGERCCASKNVGAGVEYYKVTKNGASVLAK